jgi:hypothetical protein
MEYNKARNNYIDIIRYNPERDKVIIIRRHQVYIRSIEYIEYKEYGKRYRKDLKGEINRRQVI